MITFLLALSLLSDVPKEIKDEVPLVVQNSPSFMDRQWNRYTTPDFVIISLDNGQGKYLSDHIEETKNWIYTRWGLPAVDFNKECKLVCVEDPEIYRKFFNLETSKVEIREDQNVIFFLLNDSPKKTIPCPLTEVCLVEFEHKYKIEFPWWARRGMALLNGDLKDIRSDLTNMQHYQGTVYDAKSLLTTTKEKYNEFSSEQKWTYDTESMILCLMLRKEFGINKYLRFLQICYKDKNPETALQKIYGYSGYDEFNSKFSQFLKDLTADVSGTRPGRSTPDSYLLVD